MLKCQTYTMLRKNPPKRRNGIITGGPIDNAIDTLVLIQEIKYPEGKKKKNKNQMRKSALETITYQHEYAKSFLSTLIKFIVIRTELIFFFFFFVCTGKTILHVTLSRAKINN